MENKTDSTHSQKSGSLNSSQSSGSNNGNGGFSRIPNRNTQVLLIVAVLAFILAGIAIFVAVIVPAGSETELPTPTILARSGSQQTGNGAGASSPAAFSGSTVRAGNEKTANILQTQIGLIDLGTSVPFPPTPTGPAALASADAAGQTWPMLGGNPSHTRNSIANLKLPLKKLWTVNIGNDLLSSPAVYSNTVYVGSDTKGLVSIDANSGKINWFFPAGPVIASPAVANGLVFFGNQDNQFYAVNAITGKQVWQFSTLAANLNSPAVIDGVVYFGSNDGHLYAVDANTGQRRWSFEGGNLNKVVISDSPAVADGKVFFATGSDDTAFDNFYALNAVDGSQVWKISLPGSTFSSPTIANGIIYIGTKSGKLLAMDEATGKTKWQFDLHGESRSSPAISNGVVYIGSSDKNVYAVDASKGQQKWVFATGSFVSSSPVVTKDLLFIGSNDTKLYAIDIATGQAKWDFTTGDIIGASAAVTNGGVVIPSLDGNVYALSNQ